MIKPVFFCLVLLLPSVQAPQEVTWKMLEDVTFSKEWNKEEGMYILYPKFGAAIKKLEGKEIFINGYVIPVDYNDNFYVLSAFPYSACFFCGGAGPESVMSLRFRDKKRKFKTDEKLTFRGTLKLNATDIYEMNYILEDARIHAEK
jgi:hypothetical protein